MIANKRNPNSRIAYESGKVKHYRSEVEEWKRQSDEVRQDCFIWEDLFARANDLFDRILKLDYNFRADLFTDKLEFNADLDRAIYELVSEWLAVGRMLVPEVERIRADYGSADGGDKLLGNISQAEAILTPDDEFFAGEHLGTMRDEALADDAAGRTELMPK